MASNVRPFYEALEKSTPEEEEDEMEVVGSVFFKVVSFKFILGKKDRQRE